MFTPLDPNSPDRTLEMFRVLERNNQFDVLVNRGDELCGCTQIDEELLMLDSRSNGLEFERIVKYKVNTEEFYRNVSLYDNFKNKIDHGIVGAVTIPSLKLQNELKLKVLELEHEKLNDE